MESMGKQIQILFTLSLLLTSPALASSVGLGGGLLDSYGIAGVGLNGELDLGPESALELALGTFGAGIAGYVGGKYFFEPQHKGFNLSAGVGYDLNILVVGPWLRAAVGYRFLLTNQLELDLQGGLGLVRADVIPLLGASSEGSFALNPSFGLRLGFRF